MQCWVRRPCSRGFHPLDEEPNFACFFVNVNQPVRSTTDQHGHVLERFRVVSEDFQNGTSLQTLECFTRFCNGDRAEEPQDIQPVGRSLLPWRLCHVTMHTLPCFEHTLVRCEARTVAFRGGRTFQQPPEMAFHGGDHHDAS